MDEYTERRTPSRALIVVTALVAVAIVVAAVLLLRRPATETEAGPTPAPSPTVVPTPSPAVPEQLVGVTLPTSDPAVRDLAGALSTDPRLSSWLQHQDLVRRFVASVAAIAEGKSPRQQVEFLRPAQRFLTEDMHGQTYLDPASYHRYDAVTAVFASLDPDRTVTLYRQARPLVDAAWAEIGPPGESFDTVLEAAIRQLLETPVVSGPIPLQPKVVTYRYADPSLEGLPEVQKELIRTGPENQRRIQQQLRVIAHALGIPPDHLPAAREITAATK